MSHRIAALVAVCSLAACAAPASTSIPPNHQSAAAEERAAGEHERAAGVLERQALGQPADVKCGPVVAGEPTEICWTPPRESGVAASELLRASEQRQAAVEHRRVSTALRDAEARACSGIAEADIVDSPFAHKADIVQVDVIQGSFADGTVRPVGARVRFHAIEHLTGPVLQHLVDCHIARSDAMGHDVPEMSYCPLVPRGASATVEVIPHGYIVEIRSDDPAGGREIARRATALMQ
jgi:hypothetical protein